MEQPADFADQPCGEEGQGRGQGWPGDDPGRLAAPRRGRPRPAAGPAPGGRAAGRRPAAGRPPGVRRGPTSSPQAPPGVQVGRGPRLAGPVHPGPRPAPAAPAPAPGQNAKRGRTAQDQHQAGGQHQHGAQRGLGEIVDPPGAAARPGERLQRQEGAQQRRDQGRGRDGLGAGPSLSCWGIFPRLQRTPGGELDQAAARLTRRRRAAIRQRRTRRRRRSDGPAGPPGWPGRRRRRTRPVRAT